MELSEIREKIDTVDDQLLKLFLERMSLAEEVAAYKNEHHLPILNKERERAVLARVTEQSGEKERYAYHLFSTLFELARSRQAELISAPTRVAAQVKASLEAGSAVFPQTGLVACQGVEGANSQMACDRLLPRGNIVYVKTFEAVVAAVESGLCKFGVLPIENSSAGSVTEVYDLMVRHKFYIVKSIKLHISHALLAKPGVKLEDVKEVVSHTQALQQCSNFLKANPNIKVTIFENTATAAKYVAESGRTDLAALSSTDCAKLYGLHVLQDGVQNNENNYTRFICIAKNMEIYAGSNRISLMLSLDHRPGSLHEMIGKFACRGINLCKLESRPIPGKDFEFRFYFDLDGSVFSPETMTVLKDIEQAAESLSFLGCYSEV